MRRRIQNNWQDIPGTGGADHRDMSVSRMSYRADGFVYFYPAEDLLHRLGKQVWPQVTVEGLRLKKSNRGPKLRESQANERPNFAIPIKRFGEMIVGNDESLVEVDTEVDAEGYVIVWWPWKIRRQAAE